MQGKNHLIRKAMLLLLSVCFLLSIGTSSFAKQKGKYFFGLVTWQVTCEWEAMYQESFYWYCEDHGYIGSAMEGRMEPSIQITQVRRLVDMGVDGLIIRAIEATALASAVKYATEHNVPVITTDGDVNSPDVAMYIGFSGVRASEAMAEEVVKYLRDKVEPIGKVQGTVINLRGPIGHATADDRHNGFMNVMNRYKDVKVITSARKEWSIADAKTKTGMILRAHEVDAIFGASGTLVIGAVGAIEALGKDPQDYFIAAIDAFPSVLKAIGEGKIDVVLDQPCSFYNPIAIHYLVELIEKGKGVLPKPGEIVTVNDVDIEGKLHQGVDIWAHDEIWAPAPVVETLGHPWLQTKGIKVTKENYKLESLWGNFGLEGW